MIRVLLEPSSNNNNNNKKNADRPSLYSIVTLCWRKRHTVDGFLRIRMRPRYSLTTKGEANGIKDTSQYANRYLKFTLIRSFFQTTKKKNLLAHHFLCCNPRGPRHSPLSSRVKCKSEKKMRKRKRSWHIHTKDLPSSITQRARGCEKKIKTYFLLLSFSFLAQFRLPSPSPSLYSGEENTTKTDWPWVYSSISICRWKGKLLKKLS